MSDTTLNTQAREILQAILDGETLVNHAGVKINHYSALQELVSCHVVKVKQRPVQRFIPVIRMPAGTIFIAEGKCDKDAAYDPRFNWTSPGDKLAGVLCVEIDHDTLELASVKMEKI
jgi:4-hydroxyphenylpyruvate dioxygenase-like putative hemolysin